jgi:hypothetical protein
MPSSTPTRHSATRNQASRFERLEVPDVPSFIVVRIARWCHSSSYRRAVEAVWMIAMGQVDELLRLAGAPDAEGAKVSNDANGKAGDENGPPPGLYPGGTKYLVAWRWELPSSQSVHGRSEHCRSNDQGEEQWHRNKHAVKNDGDTGNSEERFAVRILCETVPKRHQPPLPRDAKPDDESNSNAQT